MRKNIYPHPVWKEGRGSTATKEGVPQQKEAERTREGGVYDIIGNKGRNLRDKVS